jgi:hypothetical protein
MLFQRVTPDKEEAKAGAPRNTQDERAWCAAIPSDSPCITVATTIGGIPTSFWLLRRLTRLVDPSWALWVQKRI